jgi:predicted Zn-ribbon and HTH transcriptional regulator
MTANTENSYVRMMIKEDHNGRILEITFRDKEGNYGDYEKAQFFTDEPPKLEDGSEAISVNEIVEHLWYLIGSRSNLTIIPDFRGHASDKNGVPRLFLHDLVCDACRYRWEESFAHQVMVHSCPRCKSTVYAQPKGMLWIGPLNPVLQALWGRVPYPTTGHMDIGGGLSISQSPKGMIIHGDQGYEVECTKSRNSLHLAVIHAGLQGRVVVTVQKNSTSVSLKNNGGEA